VSGPEVQSHSGDSHMQLLHVLHVYSVRFAPQCRSLEVLSSTEYHSKNQVNLLSFDPNIHGGENQLAIWLNWQNSPWPSTFCAALLLPCIIVNSNQRMKNGVDLGMRLCKVRYLLFP